MEEVALFADLLVTVTIDHGAQVIRYARTERPVTALGDLVAAHERIVDACRRAASAGYALLMDMRLAPPRNDLSYELAMGRFIRAFFPLFTSYAVLMRTKSGALQVARMEKALRRKVPPVFQDEAEALQHLAKRPA